MSYPYTIPLAFSFEVNIPGMSNEGECQFQEVSGLKADIGLEKIAEGGVNDYEHKFPKRTEYGNLTFRRGILRNSALADWVDEAVRRFNFVPKPVYINLLDIQRVPVMRWTVINAYPVGIETAGFKAQENALAIETLIIAYDYFERTG